MTEQTTMSAQSAADILEQHNKWRRGECDVQYTTPTQVGQAIDVAIAALNRAQSPCPHVVTDRDGTSYCRLAESAGRAQGWQPIETWPDDYFVRLVYVGDTIVSAFKDVSGGLHQQTPGRRWKKLRQKPTHWMPLPAAPNKEEGQ